MSGGWLNKRFGPPKTMTSNSEFMGTTVIEWEENIFKGFLRAIENDGNTGPDASGAEQNSDAKPKNK